MSASILGRGSTEQPLVVDTVPWGPDTTAEVVLSAISTIATLLIPILIWWFDKRSQGRQEKQLRLQEHARLLSSTHVHDIMHLIGGFQEQCADMMADLSPGERPSYAAVFRHGRPLSRHGICITKETLISVDAARKELRDIWDNLCGDFRRQLLPGAITDTINGRIFQRAKNYMAAAEPLEAARYGRLQDSLQDNGAEPNRPYLIPSTPTQPYPYFVLGVRPGKFMWLEDQKAMQLTAGAGSLWKSKPKYVPYTMHLATGPQLIQLKVAELDTRVWEQLGKTNKQEGFIRHWLAVEAAYQQLPAHLVAAGGSSASGTGSAAGSGSTSAANGSAVGSSIGAASSSGAGAAGPSSDLAQLVARQNVLLEQLLGLMQHQWPAAAAATAAAGVAAVAAAVGSSNTGVSSAQPS